MQILKWIGRSERERRRAISADERRRRDELFIPLEVGRLEDRRVLSNVAPTLTGSGGSLTTIQQSITDTANVGTSVSQLINSSNSTNDTGKYGIAITATSGNGTWQFSTNGTTWTTITGASNTNALLLDSGDLLRYEPGSTYTSTASITFRAWDESSGTIGNYVSTALNGGATAFSNTTTNSDITIQPNISLADIGDGSTQSILDDQTIKPFNDGGAELSVTDQNNSDTLTLTLTQKVNGSVDTNLDAGTLGGVVYSENNGVYTISGLSQSQLNFDLSVFTFTPARQTAGSQVTVSFDIGVTDSLSEGVSFPNATQFGLTGNVTPVLSGTADFAGIPENSTSATVDGTAISTLIAGHTTDSNDSSLGIAITSVDNANGQWEWSTDNSTWTNLSGESGTSAFLLANGDYLRFVPKANFVGTASITFLAWDGTSGTSHTLDDPTQSPGSAHLAPLARYVLDPGLSGDHGWGHRPDRQHGNAESGAIQPSDDLGHRFNRHGDDHDPAAIGRRFHRLDVCQWDADERRGVCEPVGRILHIDRYSHRPSASRFGSNHVCFHGQHAGQFANDEVWNRGVG